MRQKIAIFIFYLVFILLATNVSTEAKDEIVGVDQNIPTERVIIKFRSLTPKILKDRLFTEQHISITEDLKLPDTRLIKLPKNQKEKFIDDLKKNILIEYIEPDFTATALEIPNDPLFSNQWGLTKTKSPGAWDKTHGLTDTEIAILDSGIDSGHPEFKDKIVSSVNCTVSGCPAVTAEDQYGHGTHVAGIAAAMTNNAIGVAGMGYDSRLISVKVLDDAGSGYYSWIIDGIIWAADNGAEVINLSLGGTYSSRALEEAVNYAWGKGLVVVAAAGNNGRTTKLYPAYYSKSIAVAATDENDNKASFSNYGSWVDLAAPGVSILSTYKSDYAYMSGTSMATPFVSGLAGLVASQNPDWTNAQIRNKIEATADRINKTGTYWIYGRINACAAVDCESSSIPEPTATVTPLPIVSPTPSLTPTLMPSPTPTFIPVPTPTPTEKPVVEPSPTLSPTPQPLPWWCKYVPWHVTCN